METISPQTSPPASISPPVTPFSIALPHTYALPPLKTLPTWNRNKFKGDKLVRSVPKNKSIKVELIGQIGQIENCTQTSPSFPSENFSSPKLSACRKSANNMNNVNKIKKSYDKKIVFLETTHQEVLSNLHQELEKLKTQNRALKFQLVMAGEDASVIQVDNDEKGDVKVIYNNNINKETEETKVLKTEIKDLKKLLYDADGKNVHLTKLIEQLKQRSSAARLNSGNHKAKTVPRNRSDYSINNNIQKRESSAKITSKQEENDPGSTNNKQNEVFLPEEKVEKQIMESSITLPKLEQPNNRSAIIASSTVRGTHKRTQEPLSLPILQGLPANRNMTLRQKRAQALHVRRQRSNKNVTLAAAATAINNE